MSSTTSDRAAGAMLGAACGDALGAGSVPGGWGAGTAMAVPILRAAAAGESLTNEATQDGIVAAWVGWARGADDLGDRTEAVLGAMREPTAAAARVAARQVHDRAGATGSGALVRTTPVALPFVQSASSAGLVRAAAQLGALTHADPISGEVCVLWAAAIRHAIRTGGFDLRAQLALLPEARRPWWSEVIDQAEAEPDALPRDGGVVATLQAAWSAVVTTPVPEESPGIHLRLALEAAVGQGDPAVAVVAGGLLGARWGASAIPAAWLRVLHGAPGIGAADLARDAVLAANGGLGDGTGWPAVDRVRPFGPRVLVPHPHDDGVLLGSLAALDDLPADVDAVVSLCRVGRRQTDREHVELWLVDQPGRNPNLDLVLRDAADTVAALRVEGKRVLVHCAEGRSRTPAVGALYSALHLGVRADVALAEVVAALPEGAPSPFLQEAVLRIGERTAEARPRPVLYVDLDTAVVDFASGIARLPAKARAEYLGRYDEAPGIVALMDPLPGAVEAFRRLAAVYDAYLLSSAPWGNPSAWQHRLEWVQLHFGAEEAGNPAWKRLILSHPANLSRGAVLVGDPGATGADRFDGELVRFGEAPFPDWPSVLEHLLAPERTGAGRRSAPGGRTRDRVVGRPSLTAWVLEVLRARGGSASVVQVAHDIWEHHEDELRRSGDLFYTWQHDLRRVAAILRDEGRLAHSADGVWRLAR